MTSKRPSLKERVFEKLGTRFRTSNEDLHKTDNDQEAANSHSEKKQATTSATVWYTHPTEEGERSDSGSKQQVVTLEPVRQESMVDNIATEKKEKKKKKVKPPGTKEYTVRETDTLSSIAAFYDTTPSALTKLNKLMTRYIYPGQILYVPDPDSDEEDTGANTQDAEILSASPERPTMDVPLIKMADRPPAKIPGHVERIPTPLSSPTKSSEFVLPHKLTEEEVESLDQECYERFIKVNVKHITDGQGVVSGVLLVTPNAVMFDPNVSDPLVLEHGAENYGVIAPMDMVVSAAMYHDIAAAMRIRGQRDNGNNVTKSEVYHDKSCQLYKSWCEGHRISSNLYLNPENLSDKSEQNPAITSPQSENGSVCSCSANQSMASPDIANHSDSVFESANQNHFDIVTKTASKDSKAENSKIGNADLTSVGPMELTSANEFGEFVSADDTSDIPLGQHLGQTNSSTYENLSNTDNFVSNQGINLQSGIDDRLGGNGRVDVTAEDGKQVPNKGDICDTNKTTFYCENELTSADQGEVTPSESADCDTQQKMRIGNIVYLPIKDGSHGKASLKDLETAQSTLSKLSFDEFEQKARSHSNPVDIPLVRSSEKNSDSKIAETKSSGSLGSFNMTPHLSAFVNYASGLFKTGSSVKDINDVLPGNEDKDSDAPDSKSEQKADSSMPSKHGKSGKDSDGKSDLEVAVESAVKLADKPELFQSFDKLIPKPATNYEDPPLYLSLRLGTPINKNVSQTCPIQAYSRKKKKPEYWFSIPRDKVDQLYAFFVQWKPEIYGDDEEMTAEKRGFVILDEDAEKLPDVMSDMYDEHFTSTIASLQKDWEIISTEESMRRKSTDVDDVILLPELIGESTIMEDFHLQMINKHMPARTVGYPWTLIYSTDLHGFSLKTLYRHMASVDSPSLLVVRDSHDFIFGAMTSCKLRPSDHFYGTGESFLFTFYPEFKVFRWTGENNFFNKGNQESLAIGAGQGQFGLWFDGDIYHGRTKRCETYDNDILTSAEDFVVKTFEAWVFTQEYSC